MAESKSDFMDTHQSELNSSFSTSFSNGNNNKNVIIFGETGSGKSSVTNMLIGQNKAETSDAALGCTFSFIPYKFNGYNLYDTVGLNEGSYGVKNAKDAVKSLIKLLKSLDNGINLLILTMKKGRIGENFEKNYKMFVEILCRNKVPVLLVVTNCEHLPNMDQWWIDNRKNFVESYKINFYEVVCVCASNGEEKEPDFASLMQRKFLESREKLVLAIEKHSLNRGWRKLSLIEWITLSVLQLFKFFPEDISTQLHEHWTEFKELINWSQTNDMPEIFDDKNTDNTPDIPEIPVNSVYSVNSFNHVNPANPDTDNTRNTENNRRYYSNPIYLNRCHFYNYY